ncbi:MAG TPA: DegT/DnrJ/EryC1/StrS family aminotransferase [Dehalococcoidia bacterium]|nr:DegT/DnrJ/EryC1/StrS family aminotransferase [Dehalococcoidia bacterium]
MAGASGLALFGGSPVRRDPLPLYNMIGEREKQAVMEVLNGGVLSGFAAQPNRDFFGGRWIEALEADYCARFVVRHAVAVNSATSGLHAALAATGIGPGDEVIVPPYTMSASATTVLYTGAVPIFADIDDEIFCLDPDAVEANITPYTKGIMAVNLFGHPAPLLRLREIADRHGLFLIEDNAQAPGATVDGRYAGTVGHLGIFSLNRHKAMQCGEGGVVICNDDDLALRVRLVRNHGEVLVEAMKIGNIVNTAGLNYRMTNMEAAVARVQLSRLDEINAPRVRLAKRLREGLSTLAGIKPASVKEGSTHVYYFFAMTYDEKATGIPRKLFARAVEAEGFTLKAGYVKPIYLEPLYQRRICFGKDGFPFSANPRNRQISYSKGICPVCERLQDHELMWTNIIYPPLTETDMDAFVEACRKVLSRRDELLAGARTLSRSGGDTLYD